MPPPDFTSRPIPLVTLNAAATKLYRIHRDGHDAVYFNRPALSGTRFRFDAPDNQFGVLYAALTFSACMFETIIRGRFENRALPLLIDEIELSGRSVSEIGLGVAMGLRLADFTSSLATVGGNTAIMAIDDYAIPGRWSLAVFDHEENVDGIYYQSRYSNEPCVALFDRVLAVQKGPAIPVLLCPELDGFLDTYHIAIPPWMP